MVRAILLCGFLLLVSSGASAAARPSLSRSVNARRLLHAGHSDESANENAADATSYLSSLQAQGLTLPDSINQALNVDPATGLNEDAVSTLMQDVQGDSVASTTASTALTADNIIDTYGGEEGTLNATATSTAALAILACKADSNCQLAVTATDDSEATSNGDNITWLKWTGAAVLFVEALIGLCVPFFLKLEFSFMQGWFLSALNCFAGGVFLTFGFMHLLPDAVSSTPDAVSIDFPMAYFFAALGFYILFLLQKVVAPLLGGRGHSQEASACGCTGACCAGKLPTHQGTPNPAYTVSNDKLTQPIASDTSSIPVPCKNCGCDRDSSPETAALAPTPTSKPYQQQSLPMTWQLWIAPAFMAAGVCVHAVLEGLALGLQRDKAGAVTVLVAMVSHKWVESVALSSITVKNGGGFKQVLCCLLPFAACFFLGTGIGVGVGHDENPWVDIVLFGLIAGAFIFVGGYELIATEFTAAANNGRSRLRRAGLFLPVLAGFTLVALLQLVHG